ncbi:MAG TPA: DUF6569 family protein [Kofleriaceae bacterium]|nr:DUF6569 family protein [Kofleriaceae bacterium]
MHAIRSSVVVVCALALLAGSARAEQPFELSKDRKVLAPVTYRNLTLMPIVQTSRTVQPAYIVLDEGMKSGVVKVIEKNADGEVNELELRNGSSQPLFLMAGEVIIGGKQDRIIGKDTIIPPRTTEVVGVFCVEHGRWSGRKASFESAGALAHTALRKKAKYAAQKEVWDEVKDKNQKRKLDNATDTYRQVAQSSAQNSGSLAGYSKHFEQALAKSPQRDQVVGFVVAVNGKVAAIETFGSPELYRKLSSKLLRSYYAEAIDVPVDGKAPKPGARDVQTFVTKARAARAKQQTVRDNAAAETVNFDSAEVTGSSVRSKSAPAAAEAAYESVYAN